RGRNLELKIDDIDALKSQFPQIQKIAPRSQAGNTVVQYQGKHASFSISGDYPVQNEMFKKPIIYGRFIDEDDIKYGKKVCVIGKDIQDELFPINENPVGKMIKIGSGIYTVVGVYKQGAISFGRSNEIHIPFTTFQRVYNRNGVVNYVII